MKKFFLKLYQVVFLKNYPQGNNKKKNILKKIILLLDFIF